MDLAIFEKENLSKFLKEDKFNYKQYIYEEGDEVKEIFFIINGEVEVMSNFFCINIFSYYKIK